MQLAPIILFVYNRPLSTQKVLDALSENLEAIDSLLFVFCDGAKNGTDEIGKSRINETRAIVRNENRFKKVIIYEYNENRGLANSIIEGVTQICNTYGSVIVLEDDIVTSKYFLSYMNKALEKYREVDSVGSINGYWYPITEKMDETFFLKNQSCWGWATWDRAWSLFESDGNKLYQQLKNKKMTHEFDLNGAIKYTKMLTDQISKKNDSWAIRWDASMFIAEKLSLYPCFSLVKNIGFDGSGFHSRTTNFFDVTLSSCPVEVNNISVIESRVARNALIKFYKLLNRDYFINRVKRLFRFTNISFNIN